MALNGTLSVWRLTNGWRELFARAFEGVEQETNLYPEWLVNPTTKRRLKLDIFYPALNVAVRFEGGSTRRPDLEEEVQQLTRDNARVTVCEAHGIHLIAVDLTESDPFRVFQEIDLMLSRAGDRATKVKLKQQIREIRATAAALARKIKTMGDLGLYADLWQDRQYQLPQPREATRPPRTSREFMAGMEVEHTIFGLGVVLAVSPSSNDALVTVNFVTAGQKTLAASLIGDKMLPR
jgi:hypothetical protein